VQFFPWSLPLCRVQFCCLLLNRKCDQYITHIWHFIFVVNNNNNNNSFVLLFCLYYYLLIYGALQHFHLSFVCMHVCVCVCVCVQGMDKILETLENMGINFFCWLHWKNISIIFRYTFVCLGCVVSVSVHYRLCLVTVCMKVLQNSRRIRFSNRTDCWCALCCSICNQNGQLIACIQCSSFQGFGGNQKSWEGIIS